jgi:nucleoside-diphosphate-sugar epimerase
VSRVLITGARGFLGRHCLPMLVAKGYEVHAVSRRPPPSKALLSGVSWHQTDLLKSGCAAEVVARVRPDYLLHLAWYAVPSLFWTAQENVDWVCASIELLRSFESIGGRRIVAAGSCAEYGRSAGECKEESTALVPSTLYGMCKHALGSILHFESRKRGLSFAWGRVFFLYGPYEHPSRLVAYVTRSLLKGEPALCSEGLDLLDFMHIEDAATAFVNLLECDVRGPVNVGSGHPVTIREILREIGEQIGRTELIRFGGYNPGTEPYCVWANTRKLTVEVGWLPKYSLVGGIMQTVEWWRSSSKGPQRRLRHSLEE